MRRRDPSGGDAADVIPPTIPAGVNGQTQDYRLTTFDGVKLYLAWTASTDDRTLPQDLEYRASCWSVQTDPTGTSPSVIDWRKPSSFEVDSSSSRLLAQPCPQATGQYTARLLVRDAAGNTTDYGTTSITWAPGPPK